MRSLRARDARVPSDDVMLIIDRFTRLPSDPFDSVDEITRKVPGC